MLSKWQFIFDQRPTVSIEGNESFLFRRNVRSQCLACIRPDTTVGPIFNDCRRYAIIRLTTYDPSLSVWSRITSCACNYPTHVRTRTGFARLYLRYQRSANHRLLDRPAERCVLLSCFLFSHLESTPRTGCL